MAQPGSNWTLLNYLTLQPKQSISCTDTATSNTTNPQWPSVGRISSWNDFTFPILTGLYGNVLNSSVTNSHQSIASASNKMVLYNYLVLNDTLGPALSIRPENSFHQEYSSPHTNVSWSEAVGGGGHAAADHIVQIIDGSKDKTRLVIGLRRPASKWTGKKLMDQVSGDKTMKGTLRWPIRQLAQACKLAKARYGYIQTEEDLTVVEFSETSGPWNARAMAIPWTNSGRNVLTTELALWFLCALALKDHPNLTNPTVPNLEDDFVNLIDPNNFVANTDNQIFFPSGQNYNSGQ